MKPYEKIKNILDDMVRKIVEGYQPEKIILFGSYAYGDPDEDSDIDLLIIKETSEDMHTRMVFVFRLVDSPQQRIPFSPIILTPKELSRRLEMGDQFFMEIMEKGQLLYES